ncbi:MAG: GNAT family N-acetyltransferase [Clostridia bacterium]|nr:GNAT family N-acetyltransferase [Clostridia bacterium]
MIAVRPTGPQDAEQLCQLQKAAFRPLYEKYHDSSNPYLRGIEDITSRLDTPQFRYFTILYDHEIAGGVLYRCIGRTPFCESLPEHEYYLARIYIRPDLQGRHIARAAILLCEKYFPDAACFHVDFPQDLAMNRRCYESAGFTDTGKRLETDLGIVLAAYQKTIKSEEAPL